jgi:mannosyltransferase
VAGHHPDGTPIAPARTTQFAGLRFCGSDKGQRVERVNLTLTPERPEGTHLLARAGRLDAVLVAAFAAAVSAAGAARPSLWFDEAATISAGTRSIPDLWRLVHNIDAVHGLYYLLMHGWFTVVPVTEFWIRFSSTLAVAGAAAGVVVLGRQFTSRSVAVCAGACFAILPRITWAGIEGRSYALTTLAAVWLTVLLVTAIRRGRWRWWPLYAAAVVVCTLVNLFLVLLVLAHAVLVAVLADRRAALGWLAATAPAVAAVIPFLLYCRTQIVQVQWISPLSADTVVEIAQHQYFDHSVPFAVLAGLTLVAPAALRRIRHFDRGERQLAALAVAWIVLPTAVLVIYSATATPIYYPRYLSFTAPAMALLLGLCIVAVAGVRERITAWVAVFALAATPNYLFVQRGPYAKEGMDFSQVADVITANARPGDCLVLDNTTDWKPGPIRPLTAARPQAYAPLVDPSRGTLAAARGRLWDTHIPIWNVVDRIRRCTVLWTVTQRDEHVPDRQTGPALDPGPRLERAPAYRIPERLGFHVVDRWQFNFAQVTKSTR